MDADEVHPAVCEGPSAAEQRREKRSPVQHDGCETCRPVLRPHAEQKRQEEKQQTGQAGQQPHEQEQPDDGVHPPKSPPLFAPQRAKRCEVVPPHLYVLCDDQQRTECPFAQRLHPVADDQDRGGRGCEEAPVPLSALDADEVADDRAERSDAQGGQQPPSPLDVVQRGTVLPSRERQPAVEEHARGLDERRSQEEVSLDECSEARFVSVGSHPFQKGNEKDTDPRGGEQQTEADNGLYEPVCGCSS
ncbi:hypothetical protein [Thermosporothrix hazakensis]|uniref:hypothetical protein n=1 Tax=Thermosporothrix hazakensis TaxID=644383 RepID=UPI0010F67786|nr:hypothetical protein [Thermosporothrix hazakensis]